MKRIFLTLCLCTALLASCSPVDLNAPIPTLATGIDSNSWAKIPAGEFYFGQHDDIETTEAYQIMITDVTAAQYADFLNTALADGYVKVDGEKIVGFYPGDEFRGHMVRCMGLLRIQQQPPAHRNGMGKSRSRHRRTSLPVG